MKNIQVPSNDKFFKKFEDMHFNQKEDEVISLSLFQMKNRKGTNDNSKQKLQKIDKMSLSQDNKIELLRGFKESLEQMFQEEKTIKQHLNAIRKMQIKQERLELQNSLKKNDTNKDQSMDSSSTSGQNSPLKSNKKAYEDLTILIKGMTQLEKDLCKLKSERNSISEQLEDAKYDLIDCKAICQQGSSELMRQDIYMNHLKKQITLMSQQGLSTPKEYINNLNQSRLNQSNLNTTIIDEVKYKFENVKDFFKDQYNKFKIGKRGANGTSGTNTESTPQNTNRILTGLDFQ